MLLVLVVALVVVGPKDLPKLMRKMGQWAAKARGMADQFRRSFDEMARQSELDELRKEIDELRNARPLADAEQAMSQAMTGPAVSMEPPAEPPPAPPEPAKPESAAVPDQASAGPIAAGGPDAPGEPIAASDQHPPPP